MRQFLILVFIITSACSNQKNKPDDLVVMEEIFPQLAESLNSTYYNHHIPLPPPPLQLSSEQMKELSKDSIKYEIYSKEFRRKSDSIKKFRKLIILEQTRKDLRNISIILHDSLRSFWGANESIIKDTENQIEYNYFKQKSISLNELDLCGQLQVLKSSYWFSNEKLQIRERWHKLYKFTQDYPAKYTGVITISRIVFSKDKMHGAFRFGESHGSLWGYGGIYFIKKVKGKWVIDYFKGTSIS